MRTLVVDALDERRRVCERRSRLPRDVLVKDAVDEISGWERIQRHGVHDARNFWLFQHALRERGEERDECFTDVVRVAADGAQFHRIRSISVECIGNLRKYPSGTNILKGYAEKSRRRTHFLV